MEQGAHASLPPGGYRGPRSTEDEVQHGAGLVMEGGKGATKDCKVAKAWATTPGHPSLNTETHLLATKTDFTRVFEGRSSWRSNPAKALHVWMIRASRGSRERHDIGAREREWDKKHNSKEGACLAPVFGREVVMTLLLLASPQSERLVVWTGLVFRVYRN